MNEEIERQIAVVSKLVDTWEWECSVHGQLLSTAKELELALTKMKLMVGVSNFDELPAYVRYLREVKSFLDSLEKTPKKGNNNGQCNK